MRTGNSYEIPVSERVPKQLVSEVLGANVTSASSSSANLHSATFEDSLQKTAGKLQTTLQTIGKISCESDEEDIADACADLLEFLPTSLTVQKILEVDAPITDWERFSETVYSAVLTSVIAKFDGNFPNKKNAGSVITRLFTVENRYLFLAAFDALLRQLRTSKEPETVVSMIEAAVKSDGLLDAILHFTLENCTDSALIKADKNAKWEEFLQMLVSLPSRVANALETSFPELFIAENYARFLLGIVIKILDFLASYLEHRRENEKLIRYNAVALLLSKILTNYHDGFKSANLKNFVAVLDHCRGRYEEVLRNVLQHLHKNAVEIMAVFLLQNLPEPASVCSILGRLAVENRNWNYALCTKIPMLSYYDHNASLTLKLISNLVQYLNSAAVSELGTLFLNLLIIWSDVSAVNHTSAEQHLYVTKFLITIARNFEASRLDVCKFEKVLHSGICAHLSSPLEATRVVGMVTSEILINYLHKNKGGDNDAPLKYDYSQITVSAEKVAADLRNFASNHRPEAAEQDFNSVLKWFFDFHASEVTYNPPQQKRQKPAVVANNDLLLGAIKSKNRLIKIIDDTDFDLDSDDELEPYDLSNDVKVPKVAPPAYLRDLRDGLVENDNMELFACSVESALKTIAKQLPNDDAAIGLELLNILISLVPPCFVENYEQIVFESCTLITSTYPKVYAEYLARQFHTDTGTYSISHRVLILDILAASAKSLAEIQKPAEKEEAFKRSSKTPGETAGEVIRKRLEGKTRRFFKHANVVYEQKNKFADVAGYYFYPLLQGFGGSYVSHAYAPKNDSDFMLLVQFLQTLSTIMCASQNCPIAPRMAKDVLKLSWFLRFHKEAKVRLAVLSLIAAAVLNVPRGLLISDFMDELLEIRLWLLDLLSPNVRRGEPNSDCRVFAEHLACLVESFLKVDVLA